MSASWSELLRFQTKDKIPRKRVAIICTPTVETLRSFEENCLPSGSRFSNQSMHSIGFIFTSLCENDARNELVECELYSIPFPVEQRSLSHLKYFVDMKSTAVKWWFLLDWKLSNQKNWLRGLVQSEESLRAENANLIAGSIIINCLHTDQIYAKQKNTTDWHSTHVEFLQQTLRSFSLANKGSLIYSDPNHERSGVQLFAQLLSGNYKEIQADFVSATRLLIPCGCDTPGLIKTLDESFEPLQVVDEQFITEKFEEFIPGRELQREGQETEEEETSEDVLYDANHPYTVNIEQELSNLYNRSKQQFAMKKI